MILFHATVALTALTETLLDPSNNCQPSDTMSRCWNFPPCSTPIPPILSTPWPASVPVLASWNSLTNHHNSWDLIQTSSFTPQIHWSQVEEDLSSCPRWKQIYHVFHSLIFRPQTCQNIVKVTHQLQSSKFLRARNQTLSTFFPSWS